MCIRRGYREEIYWSLRILDYLLMSTGMGEAPVPFPNIEILVTGTGGMAQWLRACSSQRPESVLSNHMRGYTTVCNTSSRGSQCLHALSSMDTLTYRHIPTCMHMHVIKKRICLF